MDKIDSASYIKSINGTDDILYDGKPQVAFIGRSNVGKSSLINSLIGKPLAKSSTQPGKTVKINFFLIKSNMYFVDLPGYGYAHTSQEMREHFRKLIFWYLTQADVKHKLVVLIIDAKVGITVFDRETIEIFNENKTNFVIIANKIDKLKMSEKYKNLKQIEIDSGTAKVIPYSTVTSVGRDVLLKLIFS
jgi:GTP-binding protein